MRSLDVALSIAGKAASAALLLVSVAIPLAARAEPTVVKERLGYGLSDPATGEVFIAAKYDELAPLDKGRYKATLHDRCGIVDGRGNVLVDFQYHKLWKCGPDHLLASVKFENNRRRGFKYGLLDNDGNVVVPISYDQFEIFPDTGLIKVGELAEFKGTTAVYRWGVIDLKNGTVVPIQYDSVDPPRTEPGKSVPTITARCCRTTDFFDVPVESSALPKKSREKASAKKARERIEKFKAEGYYGFSVPGGRIVAEARFEDAWDFKEGFARVKSGGKWGFIDETGRMVVDPIYDYAWDFVNGKAKVRLAGGTVRQIDRDGNLLDE